MAVFAPLRELFHTQAERMRHKPFLYATMAGAALVATADGEVSFAERMQMDRLLEELDGLRVHDVHTAVDLFNDFVAALEADRAEGREQIFDAVRRVADEPDSGRLLLRVCLLISEADGEYLASERRAIEDLADCLGLAPPETAL
jgi:tellurite resistance protein TerB